MKRVLLISILIASLGPTAARAQIHGSIDVTSDPGGTDCNFPNVGFVPIHVFGRPDPTAPDPGFFAVEFSVDLTDLLGNGIIAGEISKGSVTSGSISPGPGVLVGFPGCQASDVEIYTVNYFGSTPIDTVAYITVTPSTNTPPVLAMAVCNVLRDAKPALGGQGIINGSCNIAAEESTWGRMKALFRR